MTTNLARLKGKGAPPVADVAPDVIADDPRHEAEPQRPIQVRVPESVFMEFSEQAGPPPATPRSRRPWPRPARG